MLTDADTRRRMLGRAVLFAVLSALLLVVVVISAKLLLSGEPASWTRTGWLLGVQFFVTATAFGWHARWLQRAEARDTSYAQGVNAARRGEATAEQVLRASRRRAVVSAAVLGSALPPSMLVGFTWSSESVSWLTEVVVIVMATGITAILMLGVTTPSRAR